MADRPTLKKPPKWVIPVVGVAVLAIIQLRKKTSGNTNATEPGTQGVSNQSFIPVTGENVAGVGAGNYGSQEGLSTLTSLFTTEQQATQEYMRENKQESSEQRQQQQQENREQRESEKAWISQLFANLSTGGGAPSTGAPVGAVAAPPPFTPAAPPAPPAPAAPAPGGGCPPDFPNRGPHGCWRWSRTKTPQGCSCHGYQNGLLECEHKVGGGCAF